VKRIDYFFTPISPWVYLGHERFVALARRHGAQIAVKPLDLPRVFAASGGIPLKQRAPQRQAYRLTELARWSSYLSLPLNAQPKHFPVAGDLACRAVIAALDTGDEAALALTGALARAVWAEERDIADPDTIAAVARACGLDAAALRSRAMSAETGARYDALTAEAIERGVFGVPWYVYRDAPFWGQDRLDFLDRALAQ
jgi:2-hydroxychromene-2-carboxylate isomerase